MLVDHHRIVPQPPPQIAIKTLRRAAVVRAPLAVRPGWSVRPHAADGFGGT